MKIIIRACCPFLILLMCLSLASCMDWYDERQVGTAEKQSKYNLIGISGPASSTPYIEIQYTADDGSGHNVTVSKMVSPPFLFGDHEVNIACDSVIGVQGSSNDKSKYKVIRYLMKLHHEYAQGGAEYLRIINHSTDKTIEWFVAGTQNMVTKGKCGEQECLHSAPLVCYHDAPIYYLLCPERKYTRDVAYDGVRKDGSTGINVFYFSGDRCGRLELTKAWTVDEVMALYRAEYGAASDTTLQLYLNATSERLTEASRYNRPDRKFYGTIGPNETFSGNEQVPLLAVPDIFYDEIYEVDY
jgi:hypothetical protein